VTTDPIVGPGAGLRVDLVDDLGQRFTIWENFGQSYSRPDRDLWLNLRDFNAYFWGRCTAHPAFHPERVREVQLRFFFSTLRAQMRVDLALMTPP
jgi:hypothetical protein